KLPTTAGAPFSIFIASGSSQSATADTPFASPLVATVLDADSNPVPGATVSMTAPASGAGGIFAASSANISNASELTGTTVTITTTANNSFTAGQSVVIANVGTG